MRIRLNSRTSYISKYLFPTVWFGFLLAFMVMAPQSTDEVGKQWVFTLAPIPMAVFGYYFMKQLIFGLVDEVYRDGHSIHCYSGSKQASFTLNDIQSAIYYTQTQPHKCVLRLRRETPWGREVEFVPKIGWRFFSYNADVETLIDEVDAISRGQRP